MTPIAEIVNYDGLVLALRERANALDVSRETISEVAGLPDRYASKLLSLRHVRRIGLDSQGPLLNTLGVRLVLVEDPSAIERNRSRLVKRNASQVRVHRHR
jgi:hypothetical protein